MKQNNTISRILLIIAILLVVVIIATISVLRTSKTPTTEKTPIIALNAPAVTLAEAASGFQSPTSITVAGDTNDKRLFITERSGLIRSIIPGDKASPQTFFDLQGKVRAEGEMGLLGLAFHPDYKQNGYFFINYVDKDQNTIIARYHLESTKKAADPNSEKVLLALKQPYTNHNGGELAFGPDGYLYAALGDGGSASDPENRAQNKGSLFGKILRLDVNKGDPYGIPITNPFKDQPGTRAEIWAYGLRNPWRFSFDKSTGDLYIADVGQGALEEINFQEASNKGGENYGWRCFEGTAPYNTDGCQPESSYTAPIVEYNHDENRCSVTGGYVYRGQKHPALIGKYFYGDFCSGQLFYTQRRDGKWTQTLAAKTDYSISTFGQGSNGELYLSDFRTGKIYRLEDTAN